MASKSSALETAEETPPPDSAPSMIHQTVATASPTPSPMKSTIPLSASNPTPPLVYTIRRKAASSASMSPTDYTASSALSVTQTTPTDTASSSRMAAQGPSVRSAQITRSSSEITTSPNSTSARQEVIALAVACSPASGSPTFSQPISSRHYHRAPAQHPSSSTTAPMVKFPLPDRTAPSSKLPRDTSAFTSSRQSPPSGPAANQTPRRMTPTVRTSSSSKSSPSSILPNPPSSPNPPHSPSSPSPPSHSSEDAPQTNPGDSLPSHNRNTNSPQPHVPTNSRSVGIFITPFPCHAAFQKSPRLPPNPTTTIISNKNRTPITYAFQIHSQTRVPNFINPTRPRVGRAAENYTTRESEDDKISLLHSISNLPPTTKSTHTLPNNPYQPR